MVPGGTSIRRTEEHIHESPVSDIEKLRASVLRAKWPDVTNIAAGKHFWMRLLRMVLRPFAAQLKALHGRRTIPLLEQERAVNASYLTPLASRSKSVKLHTY